MPTCCTAQTNWTFEGSLTRYSNKTILRSPIREGTASAHYVFPTERQYRGLTAATLDGSLVGQTSAEFTHIAVAARRQLKNEYTIIRRVINAAKMGGKYKIVMVRHGESEWNQKNQFCGWYDANLSEKGE